MSMFGCVGTALFSPFLHPPTLCFARPRRRTHVTNNITMTDINDSLVLLPTDLQAELTETALRVFRAAQQRSCATTCAVFATLAYGLIVLQGYKYDW